MSDGGNIRSHSKDSFQLELLSPLVISALILPCLWTSLSKPKRLQWLEGKKWHSVETVLLASLASPIWKSTQDSWHSSKADCHCWAFDHFVNRISWVCGLGLSSLLATLWESTMTFHSTQTLSFPEALCYIIWLTYPGLSFQLLPFCFLHFPQRRQAMLIHIV